MSRSAEVDELPVQFFQGVAIVEAEIEGLDRPARLVIDSGAPTVIESSLAPHLAYSVDQSVVGPLAEDAMGRLVDTSPVLLRRLRVGRQTLDHVPAALIASDVFGRICPPIDGLLGTGSTSRVPGFLDRVAVEIDRDLQRVRIARDGALLSNRGVTLPLRRYLVDSNGEKVDDSRSWVPVVLDGQLLWAQVDTGAGGLSTMTSDVFSEMGRSFDDKSVRKYLGSYGVASGGPSQGESWIAEIPNVQLGRFRFDTLPFRIVPKRKDGVKLIVLSQGLLEQFNMVLDYRQGEFRVTLADSRPDVDHILPLQLSWGVSNGRIVIDGMLADGAAQKAGIQLGDEIVMVNGARVAPGDRQSMCPERWQTSEDSVRLTLRRDGREYEVTLPKTDARE